MTNLTPEIIESVTLNTPYYIDKSFSTDDGVSVAAICDVNGFHVFDCFECDAEELIKRINCYEQQAETIERLRALLAELSNDAEAEYEAKYYGVLNHPSMKRGYDRDMDIVNRAKAELNKLEAGEL